MQAEFALSYPKLPKNIFVFVSEDNACGLSLFSEIVRYASENRLARGDATCKGDLRAR